MTTASMPTGLQSELTGRVILPDDPDYDKARTVLAGDVDRRPAMIVRVAGVPDIRRVVDLARHSGAELAVRSGGHSAAGHAPRKAAFS
jgi:FAD/FMN-containing dehydrogenase